MQGRQGARVAVATKMIGSARTQAARYAALPDTKFDEADFAKHFPRYVWFPRGGGEPSVYRGQQL